MDYLTKPTSREVLRELAILFRQVFGLSKTEKFPVLAILDKMSSFFPDVSYAIVEDSETFDPWDELKYNSGATDKEIEGYKQRADKLYIVPVVSVNNPSSRQMPEDFSWSGNKQKWIVTFEGSASYQILSGLKAGDSVTFGKNTVQIQAPLRKWINDGELETVGVAKVQTPAVDAKNLSTPSRFHAYSGAADGADTEWKEVATL